MGEWFYLRTTKTLMRNTKKKVSESGRVIGDYNENYYILLKRACESLAKIHLIEIEQVGKYSFKIRCMSDDENTYTEDDIDITLTPKTFNVSIFKELVDVWEYNSFMGLQKAKALKWEVDHFPDLYKIYNEDGSEMSNEELERLYQEQGRGKE
jgi:hypothetical protein